VGFVVHIVPEGEIKEAGGGVPPATVKGIPSLQGL
jgi:hypothetical protein